MVEVVAEDEGGAGDGCLRAEGEGNGVGVVGVEGVGEVGGCGRGGGGEAFFGRESVGCRQGRWGWGDEGERGITAVVLDADGDGGGTEGGGNGSGVGGVYVNKVVGGRVVGGASGDAQKVFVCH